MGPPCGAFIFFLKIYFKKLLVKKIIYFFNITRKAHMVSKRIGMTGRILESQVELSEAKPNKEQDN